MQDKQDKKIPVLTTSIEENYYPGDQVQTRFGDLSRGKAWGRHDESGSWAPKSGGWVTLDRPGKWVVGSSDGFKRKERSTFRVLPEPETATDEEIAQVLETATDAKVIEIAMSAQEGNAKSVRKISRLLFEARQAEKEAEKEVKAAERKARTAAIAAERAAKATDRPAIDWEI